jgi:hypothetical protein
MEFLMASPRFTIEFQERAVLVRRRSTFKPEEFEEAFQVGSGLLARLPGSVRQELRGLT